MPDDALQAAIDDVAAYYCEHGIFQQRVGFGERPALVIVDMAYGWTDRAYAGGSARLDAAIAGIQKLLVPCRARGVPIVYTTSPVRERPQEFNPNGDGVYRPWDPRACQIDARIAPQAGEWLLVKESASAFFGTPLAAYLIQHGVDTVIVTGCSTSACVRATAVDAKAYRFRPIVPRECVQDRAESAHLWNLFDLHAKFADVVGVDEVLAYLERLA